ncbi:hypothetical protein ACSBR2_033204 [Camellia fascicularis]
MSVALQHRRPDRTSAALQPRRRSRFNAASTTPATRRAQLLTTTRVTHDDRRRPSLSPSFHPTRFSRLSVFSRQICVHNGFIGWCLPTNSERREEGQVRMDNTPTVTEQLQSMGEHLRFQSEQLQYQNAQMQKLQRDINRNSCCINGIFILFVIGVILIMKM